MPLAVGVLKFEQDLIAMEQKRPANNVVAGQLMADAFATFFGNATLLGVPLVPGTNKNPAAVKAMATAMAGAFVNPNTAASSIIAMQVGYLAYINAGLAAMWPAIAVGCVALVPLATPMAVMVPGTPSPKKKLAQAHMIWLTTGSQVALTVGGTAFFI